MSKLTEELGEAFKIYNSWDVMKRYGGKLLLSYIPGENGRLYRSPQWKVSGNGFKTDPKGHFMDYGSKVFNVFSRDEKAPQFQAALDWIEANHEITGMVKDPWGAYQEAHVIERMKEDLKAYRKAKKQ